MTIADETLPDPHDAKSVIHAISEYTLSERIKQIKSFHSRLQLVALQLARVITCSVEMAYKVSVSDCF